MVYFSINRSSCRDCSDFDCHKMDQCLVISVREELSYSHLDWMILTVRSYKGLN